MASSTSTRSSCLISSFTNTANRHDRFSSSFKFTASQQLHCHRRRGHPPQFQRHWVEALDQSLASSERFTVASYNILADRNAFHHRDLYLNVPYPFIKWDRRKTVICDELFGWNPDIICLQVRCNFSFSFCSLSYLARKLASKCYSIGRKWTSILNSQTFWSKQDTLDIIRYDDLFIF